MNPDRIRALAIASMVLGSVGFVCSTISLIVMFCNSGQ